MRKKNKKKKKRWRKEVEFNRNDTERKSSRYQGCSELN